MTIIKEHAKNLKRKGKEVKEEKKIGVVYVENMAIIKEHAFKSKKYKSTNDRIRRI